MIDVSIIIPHYDSWDMLDELLSSIPKSEHIEIIVVDDHSQNNTENIEIFNKKFPFVKFFINQNDLKGAGSSRNKGLQNATGKWIVFADSDDVFLSNFFSELEKYKDSESDIVYFKPTSFMDKTNEVSNRHNKYAEYVENYIEAPNRFNELKLRYYFGSPWSKMIKHSVVIENNIKFEDVMYANDILFAAKIGLYSQEIIATRQQIYAVRKSDDSLTSKIDKERFKLRIESWGKYAKFLLSNLSEKDIKLLNISLMPQFKNIWKNKLGISSLFFLIKYGKQNNIPILDARIFDFKFLWKNLKNM